MTPIPTMTDTELSAAVAEEVLGYKCFTETRGEYTLCVVQAPGKRPPWEGKRRPDPERYAEVSCAEAMRIGFFGVELPSIKDDKVAVQLIARMAKEAGSFHLAYDGHDSPYWIAEPFSYEPAGNDDFYRAVAEAALTVAREAKR